MKEEFDHISQHVACRLALELLNHGMTVFDLALRLDIDPFKIQQYLSGSYDFMIPEIVKLELLFDTRFLWYGDEIDTHSK